MRNSVFLAGLAILAISSVYFYLTGKSRFALTGLGLIGAAEANLLYLLLDVLTKIVFNLQLSTKSRM
jgi:hypothetical protein